uniref:Uncharacterized protein n=1 Tax=Meloidogyne incognita TaxID=6306 RepID=A0A914MCM5_MELIC
MGNKRFWGVEEETKAEEEDAEEVEDEEGIIGGGNNSCGKKPIKLLIKVKGTLGRVKGTLSKA